MVTQYIFGYKEQKEISGVNQNWLNVAEIEKARGDLPEPSM